MNLPPPPQKVSIIVPFYNAQNYIEQCAHSLIEQTYTNIEIIFINDGSQDKSREIVASYLEKDNRITLLDRPNGGAGTARNDGLLTAQGRYIMFCDADDYYDPSMVDTMVTLIEERPNIDLAMCNCKTLNTSTSKRSDADYFFNHRDGVYELTNHMKRQVNIILWNKIFKREIIDQYALDFAKIHSHEDENFIYKYLSIAQTINFTSTKLYNYRYHEASISEETRINPAHIDDYFSCFENVLNFMQCHNLLETNQNYFAEALAHGAWLIEDKFAQQLTADEQAHYALRLYTLSNHLDFKLIIDENLKRKVTELKTGNISGLSHENIIGTNYGEEIIPLIFSVDKNYSRYLITTLQSIIENAAPERNYLVIVLNCGLDARSILELEQQIENLPHFEIRIISALPFIERYKERFVEKDHFTTAIYGRLLIPEICHRFKKAIYADCDMVFNRDISELFDIDIGSNYIAAVIDSKMEIDRRADPFWTDYFKDKLDLNETQAYINSGLIVFNIAQWQQLKISKQCIEKLTNQYIFPDQDAINIICKDKILYLKQEWNCTCPTKGFLHEKTINNAITHYSFLEELIGEYIAAYYGDKTVFHYTSAKKPWFYPNMENGGKWWHYCRQTPYYEDLLQSALFDIEADEKKIAPPASLKKISLLGLPLIKIRKERFRTRFYFLGIRWLKILQKKNSKAFYFFRLKFMSQKIV